MSEEKYTSDLDGFIKNMQDVEQQARDNGDKAFCMAVGLTVKLAEEFKSKCKST